MTVAFISRRASRMMPWSLALYAGTSLVHFAHNAEYLARYPNLPASWTRGEVYVAWCCVAAVGLLGYTLYRGGFTRAGLTLLAIYGGVGFDGLLHYTRASIAHHSVVMNLTIWAELAAAALFLLNIASIGARHVGLNAKTTA
jgi:hypothetical protein